jgi:DeoR/GlpR family transcriptional regulator of sugar metabolism
MPDSPVSPTNQIEPHHQKILNFIGQKGFIKDSDYAKLVNRARSTRAADLNKLVSRGLITRKNKGKATYYTFPE